MALSSKVLVRELNALQKRQEIYENQVLDGKNVDFSIEQVRHYAEETKRVRTAWLNATDSDGDETCEVVPSARPLTTAPLGGAVGSETAREFDKDNAPF